MQLRNRLAAIFSPTRRLADGGRTLVSTGGPLGGVQWVVPRARLGYRRIELPSLPARKRDAAARIAARRMDGHADARYHVAWTGGTAHVWTWLDGHAAVDEADGDVAWIPESLLRQPPARDGLRLLAQVEGFEGQAWRDGRLHASQWWPDPPDAEQWQRFVRGCGQPVEPGQAPPVPESAPWGDPWGEGGRRGLQGSPAVLERWGWITVAAIVSLALGWQLAAQLSWSVARARLDDRLAELRAEATPLLAARERAEAARDALGSLVALQRGHDDYALVAEVVAPLPEDATLVEWVRDDASLAVVVQSAETDPRRFVAAYDGHPRLAGVVATPLGGQGMGLEFELPAPGVDDQAVTP